LIAGTAVVALLVAGCGGGSEGDSSAGGGATTDSWCDFAEGADVLDAFDSLIGSPDEIESSLKAVGEFVKQAPSEAPAEIVDEVGVLAEGTQMLIDAFADADYEILDADLSFLGDGDLEDRLDTAGTKVDEYTERECGRPFGGDSDSDGTGTNETDSDDFDPADGSLRDQLVTQFESIGLDSDEAACIADSLDFGDPAVQSGDVAAMLDVFEECGISLQRLAELGGGQ